MRRSIKVGTRVSVVRRIGQGLVVFVLLVLLGLVGAGISHAPQGDVPLAIPHGSLMAPVTGGNDPGPTNQL